MQGATDAKVAIEEAEREARSQRGGDDDHKPRFFELRGDDYRPLFKCVARLVAWLIGQVAREGVQQRRGALESAPGVDLPRRCRGSAQGQGLIVLSTPVRLCMRFHDVRRRWSGRT